MSNGVTRKFVPAKLAKEVRFQIPSLSKTDLSSYTYEQGKSQYSKAAKKDFSIFDPEGKLVLNGRGYSDRDFFWAPTVDPRLT